MRTVFTVNEQETEQIGYQLAKKMKGGETVALSGDLGAGKTVFTKGIAKGLNICSPILSPTFNIVREYQGRLKLYHFDFYRLTEVEELHEIGFEEYFQKDSVVVIEWAELFEQVLPKETISVQICYTEENEKERKILIAGEEEF